ncbi:MAG: hypothetical protein V4538_03115 [Bacteroidota bacterium]
MKNIIFFLNVYERDGESLVEEFDITSISKLIANEFGVNNQFIQAPYKIDTINLYEILLKYITNLKVYDYNSYDFFIECYSS